MTDQVSSRSYHSQFHCLSRPLNLLSTPPLIDHLAREMLQFHLFLSVNISTCLSNNKIVNTVEAQLYDVTVIRSRLCYDAALTILIARKILDSPMYQIRTIAEFFDTSNPPTVHNSTT